MRPYRDLLAWQKAHALVIEVYRVTRGYPREERFGLVSQTRRAAASVPANLAEGCGKRSPAQLRHGADIASGSLSELEYWLLLARDLKYLTRERHDELYRQLDDVRRLVHGFAEWAARATDHEGDAEGHKENDRRSGSRRTRKALRTRRALATMNPPRCGKHGNAANHRDHQDPRPT